MSGPNTNLSARQKEEIGSLMADKQHIMCTGAPLGKDGDEGEDFDDDHAPKAVPQVVNNASLGPMFAPKPASRRTEPAVSEISHVTVSGCEIGITLGALHKLAGYFWPTSTQPGP